MQLLSRATELIMRPSIELLSNSQGSAQVRALTSAHVGCRLQPLTASALSIPVNTMPNGVATMHHHSEAHQGSRPALQSCNR
jgi:hypothetical protein